MVSVCRNFCQLELAEVYDSVDMMGMRCAIVTSVTLAAIAMFIQSDVFNKTWSTIITTLLASVDVMLNSCCSNKLINILSYLHMPFGSVDDGNRDIVPIVRYGDDRLFTKEELSQYRGEQANRLLYLALLGQVYDVSKGEKHYGPGCAYHFFTGIDGTKAFITGEFTEKGLVDEVTGLLPEQMLELENWIDFYSKTYEYKGKVTGNFYDEKGLPTAALLAAKESIEEAHLKKKKDDEFSQWFPPCNSAYASGEGWVSCSDKSGGIKRDWIGVPRKYHFPGKSTPRCVCVRTEGPPSDDPNSHSNRGDLDNPHLEEYKDCDPMSHACKIL